MIFLNIISFSCQVLSDFCLGLTHLLSSFLIAVNLVSTVFPIYHSNLSLIAFGLPVLFVVVLGNRKWIAFLLGIISFVSSIQMDSVLGCIVPNQHCTSDSFGSINDCGFALFAIIYISFVYIIITILKIIKSRRENNR